MHTNYTTPQATTRAETDFVSDLDTPCLLLDVSKMNCNIIRLHTRLAAKTVAFRPHLKTAKSIEIARRMQSLASGKALLLWFLCPRPTRRACWRHDGWG